MFNVTITGLREPNAKNSFGSSVCVLPISVGEDYHEGDIFLKTIQQINSNFTKCIIIVADTLQRYTHMIKKGMTSDEAKKFAKEEGKKWLENNRTALEALTIEYEIKTWDECLNDILYAEKKEIINREYYRQDEHSKKSEFSKLVDQAVGRYIGNLIAKGILKPDQAEEASRLCREYILEEAAIMALWHKQGWHYMAYPIGHNPTNEAVFNCLRSLSSENNLYLLDIQITEKKDQRKNGKNPKISINFSNEADGKQGEPSPLTSDQEKALRQVKELVVTPVINQIYAALRSELINPTLKLRLLRDLQQELGKVEIAFTQVKEKEVVREEKKKAENFIPITNENRNDSNNSSNDTTPVDIHSTLEATTHLDGHRTPEATDSTAASKSTPSSPNRAVLLPSSSLPIAKRRHSHTGTGISSFKGSSALTNHSASLFSHSNFEEATPPSSYIQPGGAYLSDERDSKIPTPPIG